MPPASYSIVRVERLRVSDWRTVVLLGCSGDDDVDAVPIWAALDAKKQRELRDRFDTWIAGVQHNKLWFHGFTQDGYRECFVFKWRKGKGMGHRLYGFLINPMPTVNARFQVCVLTNHAEKPRAQWETDLSELDIANALRVNMRVRAAVAMEFPDSRPGGKTWTKH